MRVENRLRLRLRLRVRLRIRLRVRLRDGVMCASPRRPGPSGNGRVFGPSPPRPSGHAA